MKRQLEGTSTSNVKKPSVERTSSVMALIGRVLDGYRAKTNDDTPVSNSKPNASSLETSTSIDTSNAHIDIMSDPLQIFLPYEIVFKILQDVPRATLDLCKCVCKFWLRVACDPELAWRLVATFNLCDSFLLAGYPSAPYLNGEQKLRSFETWMAEHDPPNLANIVPRVDFQNSDTRSGYKIFDGENHIGWACPLEEDMTTYSTNFNLNLTCFSWVDEFFKSYSDHSDLWDIEIGKLAKYKQVYNRIYDHKSRSYTDEKYDSRYWPVDIYVNTIEFERYFKEDKKIPLLNFVFTLLHCNYSQLHLPQHAQIPINTKVTHKQPDGIKLKLYKYQLNAVNWMKSVEEDSDIWLKYCTLAPWRRARCDLLFNLATRKIYSGDDPAVDDSIYKARASGGILADEMGLGKTVEILGLIKANPLPSSFENQILGGRYVSRASLILCPSHLCKQWTEELEKNSDPKLKVCMITTIRQHDKFTYRNFKDADAVVVSYNFLKNTSYLSLISTRISLLEVNEDNDNDDLRNPILDKFHWKRIVLDEGHEVIGRELHDTICALESYSRWYVSGTPFPTDSIMVYLFDFLKLTSTNKAVSNYKGINLMNYWTRSDPIMGRAIYERWVLSDLVFNNLYWRNTKYSVKTEYEIPPYVDDIILLDFHPVESALYEDARLRGQEQRMRMLCNSPFLSTHDTNKFGDLGRSLEKIRQRLLDKVLTRPEYYEEKIPRLEAAVADATTKHEDAKRFIANNPMHHNWNLQFQLQSAETLLHNTKSKLKRARDAKLRWEKLRPKVEAIPAASEDELLDVSSTKCGIVQKPRAGTSSLKKAPGKMTVTELKKELKKRDLCLDGRKAELLARLTEALKSENEELQKQGGAYVVEESITKALIQAGGTKFTAAISYMTKLWNNDLNARILIFSQFGPYLRKVGTELEKNGIKNVFVEGNVHMRNSAISQFKDKDFALVRVMMLSLENAASGTNLMEASHIILLDPVQGTRKEAQAIEQQAIGRAYRQGQSRQVTVVRFIVRNTIEHQQYLLQVLDEENPDPNALKSHSNTPKLQKTKSVSGKLANSSSKLKREGSIVELIENSFS